MTQISNLRGGNMPQDAPEPIAIIGMGVRFPGASDVESFWRLLAEGRETVGEYAGGRFQYIDDVYSAQSAFAERLASRRGGFLDNLDQFDAEFFGMSPREAALLDPQQRLLLEVAWEAVDDAGLARERLAGTRAGVFVGVWTSDYEDCLNEASPEIDFHGTTGSGRYAASGRLAYVLNLRGPCLTVDTACSSSLVAIHLACQSLRARESTIALAGGANAILRPEVTLAYSDAGMLAPDGRCKFADASADGYVRSEGAGIVVLKRLSDAIADGDSIYAVIRGSAVNNNGQSSGQLVAPSRAGQEDVIRSALDYARVEAADLAYVEAHGTGTLVGDPIEIESIGRVVATAERRFPCAIGSIKTNIGHTESAAGVAGVMKVALALDRGLIPASLHFRAPNPRIPWADLPIAVANQSMPWPRRSFDSSEMPIAGVTGIGITGTNAHAVLQGFAHAERPAARPSDRPLLFALSGHTPDALRAVASSWLVRLQSDAAWPASLADLAYSAGVRHTHHDERLVLTANSREDLMQRLGAWLDGEALAGIVSDHRLPGAPSKAVFVYPGQGGQWLGMGRTLLDREQVFRDALLRCDEAIAKHVGWSVIEELRASAEMSRLEEIDVVQPTLFAVMIGLTELLRSFGVEPSAVVGHSMGEVAAATVAGALSLDDAAAVICHRSRLMKGLRGRGAMAVVELGLDETRALITGVEGVSIAASNAARSTIISGDVAAVESILDLLEAREVFCRRIKVDVASHSNHMDVVRTDLETALAQVAPCAGTLPIYSTTTGEVEDGRRLDARYWGQNLRQPVLFHQAIERLFADGFDTFVEINAHPVLTHSLSESAEEFERRAIVTGTLRRDSDERIELLSAVGRLHAAGFPVNWGRMHPSGISLRLPTYPWQRERHWFDAAPHTHRHPTSRDSAAKDDASQIDPAACVTEIAWVDTPATTPGSSSERRDGHWIVFDVDGVGNAIAASLGACTIIRPGAAFRAIDANTIEIDPSSDEDLRRALTGRLDGCAGIIHAWAASAPLSEAPELDALWASQARGCFAIAGLARILAEFTASAPVRLWVVTRGLHQASAADAVPFPLHGSVSGLQRAIAREHPELSCTHVDLSVAPTESDFHAAAAAISEGAADQQILIRGRRRLVARYRRTKPLDARSSVPSIRSDATYLVTGGLGGIARHVARWLVARGARSIVLTGRSAPRGEAAECVAALEAQGATVRVVLGDLAKPDDVARLIAAAVADERPLRGVFHLAAVVDDTLLINASNESHRRVLQPKMAGGWNLYRGLLDQDLDFWMSFSSIAAVVSQPGQGPYAAANAFLDGLARYATARGRRMQSLQWGPWADTGLAHEEGTQRSFHAYAEEGIQPLTPAAGISVLEYAMTQSAPVALTASVDWAKFAATPSEQAIASEFQELAPAIRSADVPPAASRSDASAFRERLTALPSDSRRSLLEAHLRDELAVVLRTAASRIDPKKPMGSMGVDSLMALEFVRRLSRSTGVKLPATSVFNYPTVAALAKNIQSRMALPGESMDEPASTAGVAQSVNAVPHDLAGMSDDEALRALVDEPRVVR